MIWVLSLQMAMELLGTPACERSSVPATADGDCGGTRWGVLSLLWPFSHSWWELRCYWGSALGPLSDVTVAESHFPLIALSTYRMHFQLRSSYDINSQDSRIII